ncbi:MAG: SpoIIE family protein phosphatase, partial [Armatimonadota bacterium]|nr:SpoIIE family protein phosphatase [Armatimonadota bacterium]
VALAKFQAEEALRKSERRLNRSQEIAHLGSWELDLVKDELTWSDEVYRIFGLQPQEFAATYEAFLDAIHSDDRASVDAAYSGSVREGKSTYEIQHRVVRKSTGEVRWVHERCEHIRDESGNIIRSIGMVMDITDRKRSEQELELAHAETERRAAELETFIESMGDAVALFDVQGKIVLANDAAMRMLGAPAGIPLGEVSQKYRLYTTDGDPLPVEMYPTRRALRGEKRSEARCKFVTPWTEGVVHITASPVRDTAGGIVGVVTISRDVREQVEFERQREEVYQREHRIADILQKALIPEVSYEIPGYDIAVRYEPALKEAEVGGDFYDIFDLGEGRMGALIGDVVGKGLPAAIRVAAARHAIRSYAYLDPRPSRVMTLANDALSRDEAGDASMLTAFFAVIDTRLGAVTYANGGHETTIIRRSDGTIEELSTDGRALGVFEGFIYSEGSELLRPGDTIVMMTDGITEARPSPIALFGIERVKDYLNRTRQTSPEEIADGLLKAAKKHAAGSLSDDAAVVVIQVKKEPTRKTR